MNHINTTPNYDLLIEQKRHQMARERSVQAAREFQKLVQEWLETVPTKK